MIPLIILAFASCTVKGINLALNKPTWQTFGDSSSSRAVDGLTRDRSAGGGQCAISAASSTNVTWWVDLGDIRSIKDIRILYRTENRPFYDSIYAGRFLGFSLYVSNTTNKDDGFLCYHDTKHNRTSIHSSMVIGCDIPSRYVIYYNTREGALSNKPGYSPHAHIELCEVQVVGCPLGFFGETCSRRCEHCSHCAYTSGICLGSCDLGFEGYFCQNYARINMAVNRPTYQSTTILTEYPSGKTVDGKHHHLSIFGGECTSTADGQSYALLRVDLERPRRIERVMMYSRTDNIKWDMNNGFKERLLGFSIIVSNTTNRQDGVVRYRNQDTKYSIGSFLNFECVAIGRYVFYYNERLAGTAYPKGYSQHAYGDLCEIQIYGCPFIDYSYDDPECTVPCASMCKYDDHDNLSYMKPTWQSSTAGSMESSKAVDGNTGRNYGQCTSTVPGTNVTWWVDLQKRLRIHSVILYFRTDSVPWGDSNGLSSWYLGFSVYISNTTNQHDGVQCYHDTAFTSKTISSYMHLICPYSGRYVIYYNERLPGHNYPSDYSTHAHGDLCEVEVFGCPYPILNLPQCLEKCPGNCEECYPETGICKQCKSGYQGTSCELSCFARADVTISDSSIPGGPHYEAMFSSKGLNFPGGKDSRFVTIYLRISDAFSDISNISFSIVNAESYSVHMQDKDNIFSKREMYNSPLYGSSQWETTVNNPANNKVHLVTITVKYWLPFTIANVKLPLRKCIKETTTIVAHPSGNGFTNSPGYQWFTYK